jgi:predicted enzyme related to lactoylglutathione lyase
MDNIKSVFKKAIPYHDNKMNLPVESVDSAIPFYENMMGFKVISRDSSPNKSAVLERDQVQIAIVENGGDPTQDGCFFEVNDVQCAFQEMQSKGLGKKQSEIRTEKHGNNSWRIFYIIAPDGLCYSIGEPQP